MLKTDRSFHRRWEIVLADNKTSTKKPPFHIRRFFLILVLLGFLGGFLALTVPLWKSWTCVPFLSSLIPANSTDYSESKAIADLRLHILYITGGVIAILTLLQTDWKNQIDHRKVEDDIQKNKNDHIRQVRAERRSRYTKAVEQLANEKAAVRLGGIYTLAGLVDEWLADGALNPEERQKEGQVIINNLCSYVRSPFLVAEQLERYEARKELDVLGEFEGGSLSEEGSPRYQALFKYVTDSNEHKEPKDIAAGYAELREEQDVRRAIFVEMSKRSSIETEVSQDEVSVISCKWSDFDFDFSRAPIFYPLNALTIVKGNFSSAKFYGKADFREAIFTQTANFDEAVFTNIMDFSEATFTQTANFDEAVFINIVDFSKATFTQTANFNEATFSAFPPIFVKTYEDSGETVRAQFTALAKHYEANKFTASRQGFPIPLGEAELNGKKYHIPEGTVLFDPDSWDEETKTYTRVSKPAKPLENSDTEEEKPTE